MAISNQRLVAFRDAKVSFRWKDYARGDRQRIMTLSAVAFIGRFLLHVLPKSFVRIRHFGLLANPVRARKLERCRTLLGDPNKATASINIGPAEDVNEREDAPCPKCGKGHLTREVLIPVPALDPFHGPPGIDSS